MDKNNEELKNSELIILSVEASPQDLCYSQICYAEKVVASVNITNNTEDDFEGFKISFAASSSFILNLESTFISGSVKAEGSYSKNVAFNLNQVKFREINENSEESLFITLFDSNNNIIASTACQFILHPMYYWTGKYEALPVFVERNHSGIRGLIKYAGEAMNQLFGSSSLTAYQSEDPNMVIKQCAAIYTSMQHQRLIYSSPKQSDEYSGQIINDTSSILKEKTATCLDTTLMFSALAESIGLHPLICMVPGHSFPGVWLYDDMSLDSVIAHDPSFISQNCQKTNPKICLIESTMTTDPLSGFESAHEKAISAAIDATEMTVIDIKFARKSKIRPLPQQTIDITGAVVFEEDPEFAVLQNRPEEIESYTVGKIEIADNRPKTKFDQWERSLIDTSLRNPLMNVKINQKTIPLLVSDIGIFENTLSEGTSFTIIENPLTEIIEDPLSGASASLYKDALQNNIVQTKLPTSEKQIDLEKKLANIFKHTQKSQSESGVNPLYLAIGLIEWNERDNDKAPCFKAPLLLYPVNLEKKSKSVYNLSLRDDEEPKLNYSVFEYFSNIFGYKTKLDYENLPKDENGLDIKKIFEIIKEEINSQKRWRLLQTCVLGLFSFDQFVMLNDIRKFADKFSENKVISSLVKGKLAYSEKPIEPVTDEDFISQTVPVDLDESQLKAVKAAGTGNTFILQGPPGTGKSQTITGIIVNAIANGKKVLFVAEKMAALQVVYRNLKELGIDRFLLELHSVKATKARLIEQLQAATDFVNISPLPERNLSTVEKIQKASQVLNQYMVLLHKKLSCGLSLYEIINAYSSIAEFYHEKLEYSLIKGENTQIFEDIEDKFRELSRMLKRFQPISHSPYKYLNYVDDNISVQAIENVIKSYATYLENGETSVRKLERLTGLSKIDFLHLFDLNEKIQYIQSLRVPKEVIVADDFEWNKNLKQIQEYREHCKNDENTQEGWNPAIFEKDIPRYLQQWSLNQGIFKRRERRNLIAEVGSYAPFKITEDNFESSLRVLNSVCATRLEYNKIKANISPAFKGLIDKSIDELSHIRTEIKEYSMIVKQLGDWGKISDNAIRDLCLNFIFSHELSVSVNLVCEWKKLDDEPERNFITLLCPNEQFSLLPVSEKLSVLNSLLLKTDLIQNWALCNKIINWFNSRSYAAPFLNRIMNGESISDVMNELKADFYFTYIEQCIKDNTWLHRHNGEEFEGVVSDLKLASEKYRKQLRDSLPGKFESLIQSKSLSSYEADAVQRFISTKGKRRTIRSLFQDCGTYITDICPCLLMSPLSVSQFIRPDKQLFDIVVFDEASQILTSKAVGAMARAKDVIVVGDSKQMPPTNFFKKTTETDTDFDEEIDKIQDLESFLDDCNCLGIQSSRLNWHYRSSNESLITFSNRRYYQNRLKTYPSVDAQKSRVFLKIVKGYYQPSNKEPNPAEAKAIVEEIKKRLSDESTRNQSIGVITFSEKQQSCVTNKLDEMFERNRSLARLAHWDENEIDCPKKLIVKNLENIQGDERDVIMLSVTYGPTVSGRFSTNFGPINSTGGEKRLNVAFSRAKEEMVVFTIMDPAELSSKELVSKGARDLRDFILYAKDNTSMNNTSNSVLAVKNEISDFLKANGYFNNPNIGYSDFKVDLGILDKDDNISYYCGILLDGTSMTTSTLSNDRYVLRRNVLKRRGWQTISIRTFDWLNDKESEKKRILKELSNIDEIHEREKEQKISNAPAPDNAGIEVISTSEGSAYKVCELNYEPISSALFIDLKPNALISKYQQVIDCEYPIIDDLLQLRVLNSFGLKKRGKKIQPIMDNALKSLNRPYTLQIGKEGTVQRVYWSEIYKQYGSDIEEHYTEFRANLSDEEIEDTAHRNIDVIPHVEIFNAMVSVLKENNILLKKQLIDKTADVLGFKRKGTTVIAIFDVVIKQAVENGKFIIDATDHIVISSTSNSDFLRKKENITNVQEMENCALEVKQGKIYDLREDFNAFSGKKPAKCSVMGIEKEITSWTEFLQLTCNQFYETYTSDFREMILKREMPVLKNIFASSDDVLILPYRIADDIYIESKKLHTSDILRLIKYFVSYFADLYDSELEKQIWFTIR